MHGKSQRRMSEQWEEETKYRYPGHRSINLGDDAEQCFGFAGLFGRTLAGLAPRAP